MIVESNRREPLYDLLGIIKYNQLIMREQILITHGKLKGWVARRMDGEEEWHLECICNAREARLIWDGDFPWIFE